MTPHGFFRAAILHGFLTLLCVLSAGMRVEAAEPPESGGAPALNALVGQIKGPNPIAAIDAARRLGETKSPAAVEVLKEAFDQAPKHHGKIDVDPGLAETCVRALGKIGGPSARRILREIAEQYVFSGHSYDLAGKTAYDGQTMNIIAEAILALGEQDDKETQDFLMGVAKDKRVPQNEMLIIRRWCYKGVLRIEMQSQRATTAAARGTYIARVLAGGPATTVGGRPASEMRTLTPLAQAAEDLLVEEGPEAAQEAERLLLPAREGPATPATTDDANRRLLEQVRKRIENIQKSRQAMEKQGTNKP